MAHLQYIVGGLLVLTMTVLLNTRPAEAQTNCASADDCKNGGKCPNPNTDTCNCDDSAYKGDTCEDECAAPADCGTGGTCGDDKKCTCADEMKEGPGCTKDKSGASAVTGFSLMSLFVILTASFL